MRIAATMAVAALVVAGATACGEDRECVDYEVRNVLVPHTVNGKTTMIPTVKQVCVRYEEDQD